MPNTCLDVPCPTHMANYAGVYMCVYSINIHISPINPCHFIIIYICGDQVLYISSMILEISVKDGNLR